MMHFDSSQETQTVTKVASQLKEPPLYAVVMHNDDYTTMDFVVFVLMEVFDYDISKAMTVMMDIHQKGRAKVAIFPKEIAEMKIVQVESLAQQAEFPLLTTLEKQE